MEIYEQGNDIKNKNYNESDNEKENENLPSE